jgi:hypothetical protein
MTNVLIVPVHPPKVLDLIRFLKSCDKPHTQTHVMLVCTNWAEAEYVQSCVTSSSCAKHLHMIHHVVDAWSDHILGAPATNYLLQNTNSCVVNFKKFAALHHAHAQGYQFAVLIDVDAWCLGDLDVFMHMSSKNYQTGKFWGCKVSPDAIGMGSCTLSTSLLGVEGQNWCKQQGTLAIYNWFLDPPSYGLSDVHDMFTHMAQLHGGLTEFFMKLSWFTYDFLVFSQWMAWQQRAQVLDYSHILGENHVPEILCVQDLVHLSHVTHIRPVWVSTAAWLKQPQLINQLLPDCHMLYHVDRPIV